MPDTEGKYVVFKRDEFDLWAAGYLEYLEETGDGEALPRQLQDCVVIRHDDVFAPTAFYSYAGVVQGTIEVLNATADTSNVEKLREIADFFTAQAERAELTPNKHLPKGES